MDHVPPPDALDRPVTMAERIADAVMHLLGTGFAITGTILLILFATGARPAGDVAAVAVYGGAMIASFVVSACYHLTPWESLRPSLRRMDHAAIYLKIAGTYTPLAVLIGTAFSWAVLGVIWALATAGAAMKLFVGWTPGRISTGLYLVLGWASLALVWPLSQVIPPSGLVLILVGGLLYSVGTVIFHRDGLRFQNAVWHGFVLAGSACFFAAITVGLASS